MVAFADHAATTPPKINPIGRKACPDKNIIVKIAKKTYPYS